MTDVEIPLQGEKTRAYRLFEIIPALLSWTIIFLPIILAFINPTFAAYFVVAFMVLWLIKVVSMSIRVTQGYNRLKEATSIDWNSRLNDLENADEALARYKKQGVRDKSEERHYTTLCEYVADRDNEHIKIQDAYNIIIIAAYNESMEVLEPTVKSVLDSKYDTKHIILAIAYEERGGKEVQKTAKELIKRYGDNFKHAEAIMHPKDIPNEVIGKGGNITYAGKKLAKYAEQQGMNPNAVIVTTLDSDNRPHPQYLSHLTYMYAADPRRKYRSFQPIPMFLNNIWDVPAPMRVLATGNSFWNLIVSARPHLMRNFSAHAQGLQSLLDTDFWSVRTIVEDGHQFWRTYLTYDGNHFVVPLYVPVYQDAVLDTTYVRTLKAQFIQLRRWAWGASDIAYLVTKGFFTQNRINKPDLFFKTARLFEAHISWATVPLILAFAAWIPLVLSPEGQDSIVAHQLPTIASRLNTFIAAGIVLTVFLSMKVLPPKPPRYKAHKRVFMVLQWLILPITSIIYGSFAALYSQTRLMFGRYLGKFDVTAKVVKK